MSDSKSTADPSMEEILATIRRIIAEDERPGTTPPAPVGADRDVLALTEAVGEDGTIRHITPIWEDRERALASDGRVDPPLLPEPQTAEPAEARGNPLVSVAAADAVAAAFARLSALPPRERRDGEPAPDAARSLEEVVRELLRPQLQAWLDAHLPGLVERLVQAEIARVVGEAGPR